MVHVHHMRQPRHEKPKLKAASRSLLMRTHRLNRRDTPPVKITLRAMRGARTTVATNVRTKAPFRWLLSVVAQLRGPAIFFELPAQNEEREVDVLRHQVLRALGLTLSDRI